MPNVAMWAKAVHVIPRVSKEEWDALDLVSRWLIATRSAVLVMTFISAAIAGLLAAARRAFDLAPLAVVTVGLLFAHATNNLVNDLTDHLKGVDKDNYFRTQYGPQPLEHGLMTRGQLLVYIAVTGLIALAAGARARRACAARRRSRCSASARFFVLFYTWPLKYIGLGELGGDPGVGSADGRRRLLRDHRRRGRDRSSSRACRTRSAATTVLFGKHIDKLDADRGEGHPHPAGAPRASARSRYAVLGMLAAQPLLLVALVATGYFTPAVLIALARAAGAPARLAGLPRSRVRRRRRPTCRPASGRSTSSRPRSGTRGASARSSWRGSSPTSSSRGSRAMGGGRRLGLPRSRRRRPRRRSARASPRRCGAGAARSDRPARAAGRGDRARRRAARRLARGRGEPRPRRPRARRARERVEPGGRARALPRADRPLVGRAARLAVAALAASARRPAGRRDSGRARGDAPQHRAARRRPRPARGPRRAARGGARRARACGRLHRRGRSRAAGPAHAVPRARGRDLRGGLRPRRSRACRITCSTGRRPGRCGRAPARQRRALARTERRDRDRSDGARAGADASSPNRGAGGRRDGAQRRRTARAPGRAPRRPLPSIDRAEAASLMRPNEDLAALLVHLARPERAGAGRCCRLPRRGRVRRGRLPGGGRPRRRARRPRPGRGRRGRRSARVRVRRAAPPAHPRSRRAARRAERPTSAGAVESFREWTEDAE